MGGFPSGQRGQTVNLLHIASVVRIHHHPGIRKTSRDPMDLRDVFLLCLIERQKQAEVCAGTAAEIVATSAGPYC